MNYLVSGWLIYASLMLLHNAFTPGKKAKIHLVLNAIGVIISLSLILLGVV